MMAGNSFTYDMGITFVPNYSGKKSISREESLCREQQIPTLKEVRKMKWSDFCLEPDSSFDRQSESAIDRFLEATA